MASANLQHLQAALHPFHNSIHVLEGDGYEPTAVEMESANLVEDNAKAKLEIERLRGLLRDHDIPWALQSRNGSTQTAKGSPKRPPPGTLESSRTVRTRMNFVIPEAKQKNKYKLPLEILRLILGYAVTSSVPIIDPFFKLRKGNCTKEEYATKKKYCINFLATSEEFNTEGTKLLITRNTFIFTQAAALENFQRISPQWRSAIESLTFRVVGQYYDEEPRKLDLTGTEHYHPDHPRLVMPILARPRGLFQDDSVQSYCWLQLTDFFKAMMIPPFRTFSGNPASEEWQKLLPNLKSLRLDLVNFSDHLPFPGPRYAAIIRWYVGRITDELLLTGCSESTVGQLGEEDMLHHMIRDEGIFGATYPVFVSNPNGNSLIALHEMDFHLEVVRASTASQAAERSRHRGVEQLATSNSAPHSKGGMPPKSKYRRGKTIWKWTVTPIPTIIYTGITTRGWNGPRSWIEFDRKTGMPMSILGVQHNDEDFEVE